MKLSSVLPILFATHHHSTVASGADTETTNSVAPDVGPAVAHVPIRPNSLRGTEDSVAPPEYDRLPRGGTCCNCIHVLDDYECAERGKICVRCETFATGEGRHTHHNGQSTGVVDGNIYFPLEGAGPWPVVTFGHGLNNNGVNEDRKRRNLMLFMVEMGFVVVAHREEHQWPAANYAAQLKVLDWLYESQFAPLVDRSATLLMGFSMGGRGTLTNAANPSTLEKYNVKAAIAMHPWCIDRCRSGTGDCGIPLVPTLWVTGNEDDVAIHDVVYTHYAAQVLSDKVFVERVGQTHHYPDNFLYDNDASMENTFRRFVQCEVFNQEAACVALFGKADLSNKLGEDSEGVDLAIERDDNPAGFFQPWRGPGYYPEGGTNWNGYSQHKGYRLTIGPATCTDSRDCKGRNPWCIAECRNPVFCGKWNNCERCLDEPNYPSLTEEDEDNDLAKGTSEGMLKGALEVQT